MALWVAVGMDAAAMATVMYSGDGLLWQPAATPLDGGEALAIAWNGSVFVVVGYNGDASVTIATSPDLVTWTARPNLFDGDFAGSVTWADALGLFVAVGEESSGVLPSIITSPDGITWTPRTAGASVDGGTGQSVVWAADLGLLVASFSDNNAAPKVATSPDAIAWSDTPGFAGHNGGPHALGYHAGLFLAAGQLYNAEVGEGTLAKSADGLNWTMVATPLHGTNAGDGRGAFWDDDHGQWIHTGIEFLSGGPPSYGHVLATSPDAIAWTARTTPLDGTHAKAFRGVARPSRILVGCESVGGTVLLTSTDGAASWSAVPTPFDGSGGRVDAVAYFDAPAPSVPRPAYTLKIVEQDGAGGFTVIRTIPKVSFTSPPTKVLNGIGSMGFQLAADDPALADLATDWLRREVQLYRGTSTVPWWWGVPMQPSKSPGSPIYTIQCAEVIPWLLSRRNFGKTARHNLLEDPQFESGVFAPNWFTTGVDTAVVTSADQVLGTYAADLTEASAAPDASVQQIFTYVASSIGDLIPVAGWFKIVSFTGSPFANRGLHIQWSESGVFKDSRSTIIDGSTPVGKWQKAELPPENTIWIPPGVTAEVNIRGYAVQGQDRWDAMFAGVMESTSTLLGGSDIASFAAAIVNHAQDPAYDKDDLSILTSAAVTGYLINMSFQHAEHANIWSGIKELIDRDQGIDVGWTYTSNSRTFVAYDRTGGALGKGTDRTALDLSLGGIYAIDYGNNRDGNQAANYITILGSGNGPAREEGGFTDDTKFGGRHFEVVAAAPPEATINTLAARAAKLGGTRSRPGVIDVVLRPGVLIEGATTLDTGDKVTLPAYDAMVDTGDHRVVGLSLNPSTDVLTASCAAL